MLLITCPYCGEKREEEEFAYADEAFIVRPSDPESLNDQEWAEYLFVRDNVRGLQYEKWAHTAGCRKFFIVKRNNRTNEIETTMTMQDALAHRKHIVNTS